MTILVGFDPGNSEATLSVAANGKQQSLTIPSFIGSGSLEELRRIRGGTGRESLEPGEYVLACDGRSHFVGTLALEQSDDATSARGNVLRYWTGHTCRLLLTLAGALVPRTETVIRLVTGLPVQVWSKETLRQVQQSLVGEHHFTLNGRPRTLVVEGVMVLMEGAGALALHGMNEDVPQAVVDVGGRTTDLFWAQGMRPVLPRCMGAPIGVEKIGDAIGADFLRQHRRDLQPREVRQVLRSYASGSEAPPLFAGGVRVQLNGEVRSAAQSVGQEVASFVARTWRSSEQGAVAAEAARVLLIGGGAYYLADALRQAIPHLEVPRHPELVNAQGYLAVGGQIPEGAWAKLRGV
jgi:hypothetical protein